MSKLPNIYGFNKTSEVGQDIFAPSIFLGGCNLKCPYCMNARLVKKTGLEIIDIKDIKDYILAEKVNWINISGGEPTLTEIDLLTNLLEEIKSWNCKIGMSSNGSKPYILELIMPYLNYVAMDFKCVRKEDCEEIGGKNIYYLSNILKSQFIITENRLKRNDFNCEFRTTLFPKFVDKAVINDIGSILRKDDNWVLQQFRHNKNMLDNKCQLVAPYNEEEINKLLDTAKKYCNVTLKYV